MLDKSQVQYLQELQESYPNSADLINFLQNGKTKYYSFWSLIGEYEIEIPIIQRDYAQGRTDNKSSQIRSSFIKSLISSVLEQKRLHLDFIYGSSKQGSPLVLLDGQQRITTLFLLHWFVLYKLKRISEHVELMQRFTYKTRISSKEFCNAILNRTISDEFSENLSFSENIKNQAWFFRSWEKDPTIKGMLVTLDTISESLPETDDALFKKMLYSLKEENIIDFQFLNLDDFELTDELYIKMNARGKTLTNFENYKAWLIQNVEEKPIKPDNWSTRLDLEWTDLFWSHKASGDYEIDTEYMQYFRGMSQYKYALTINEAELSDLQKDNLSELIDSQYVPYSLYDEYALFSPDNVNDYFNILEKLEGDNIELLKEILDTKDNSIFKRFIDTPNYWDRTLFFALCTFLWSENELPVNYTIETKENLKKWMRVWRNFIINTTIDDPSAFVKAINEIHTHKNHIHSLYDEIASLLEIKFFSENQRKEEKLKAILINENSEWEKEFIKYEKHKYFYGQIGFLIEYSNVNDRYDIELFKSYAEKASVLFSKHLNSDDYILERALLTKGNGNSNYLIWKNSNLSFCLSSSGTLRQREENWRRVFRNMDKNRGNQCLKALLDDNRPLNDIIKDADVIEDWRKYVIKEPKLLQYCNQKMLRKDSDTSVRLLGSSRLSHYHVELYTYFIYHSLKKKNKHETIKYKYVDVRGGSEYAHLTIDNWSYKRKTYSLSLYYDESSNEFLPNPFQIRFYKKSERNVAEEDYDKELLSKLFSTFDFNDEKEWHGYWKSVKTLDEAKSLFYKLCSELDTLN
nr:DUF262 domain-containing protein [uncultured Carboxylicivirga sp.]